MDAFLGGQLPFTGIARVIEGTLEAVPVRAVRPLLRPLRRRRRGPRARARAHGRGARRVSWFLAFAGFALLVMLHELGHFSVAKAVGMRVEKFSLFFPPTLASKKVGETEYAIGAIPAGGYVKISGMNPDEDLPDEVRDRAYYSQPVWKRIAVIAAGPAVNLVLALVLLFIYFFAIGPETAHHAGGRRSRRGIRRPRCSSRATASSPWTAFAATPAKLSPADRQHTAAPQRPPTDGCARVGPRGAAGGARRAQARDRGHAGLRPRRRSGRGWASPTPPGPREALRLRRVGHDLARPLLVHHQADAVACPRACSTPSSARRSPASSARTRSPARRSSTTWPRWSGSWRSSRSRWRS